MDPAFGRDSGHDACSGRRMALGAERKAGSARRRALRGNGKTLHILDFT